jgi:hypothetical protein
MICIYATTEIHIEMLLGYIDSSEYTSSDISLKPICFVEEWYQLTIDTIIMPNNTSV